MSPVQHAEVLQHGVSQVAGLGGSGPLAPAGHNLQLLTGCQGRKKVVTLKNEAAMIEAKLFPLLVIERPDIFAHANNTPLVGSEQAREDG